MKELKWKTIDGFEDCEVSNNGLVRNKKTSHIYKCRDNGIGYLFVELKGNKYYIHRLVAKAFISNPNNSI